MSKINKYGLSRTIPETVKRKIRKNSGFGCVICGAGICEYEHVEPEWVNAVTHNPKFMTLLCPSCHSKKTRGIISKEKVKEAMLNPKCKTKGFTFDELDFGSTRPLIQFGKILFVDPLILISINNISYFTIIPPINGEPFKLNAIFSDNEENELVAIENNIWKGNSENWDIETKGRNIIVKKKLGEIALHIENIPREKFVIHKINMNIKGYNIFGDNNGIKVTTPSKEIIGTLDGGGKIGGKIALNIQNERVVMSQLCVFGVNLNI